MHEKRRCHRFKLEVPAWFKASPLDESFSIATTIDVSALGICLASKAELEIGQEILMQVKLPSEEILMIRAKVIWIKEDSRNAIREYRIGVKVLEPINHDESKFVRFCAMQMLEFAKSNSNPYDV